MIPEEHELRHLGYCSFMPHKETKAPQTDQVQQLLQLMQRESMGVGAADMKHESMNLGNCAFQHSHVHAGLVHAVLLVDLRQKMLIIYANE